MSDRTLIDRRTALKGIGGIGAVAVGGYAFTDQASAGLAASTLDATDVTVESDRGDVDEIHLAPTSTIEWKNFDVPVTKIRQLLEARIEDEQGNPLTPEHSATPGTQNNWWPIWRETPWLFTTTDPGGGNDPDFQYRGSDAWFAQPSYATDFQIEGGANQKGPGTSGHFEYPLAPSATDPSRSSTDIYVVSETYPMPDYPSAVGSLGETMESLFSGVSIAGGGNFSNGSYGTVAGSFGEDGSTLFDNDEDGTTATQIVRLRLTTTLHTDYDFVEHNPSGTTDDRFTPLAMGAAPDVGHQFSDIHAIPYADLRAYESDHPAIDVVEQSFEVNAENEPSDTGSSTSANTGGS